MSWTQKKLEELYQEINKRLNADPVFTENLKKDPKKTLEELAGQPLPEGFSLKFIEKDDNYGQTYVLPDFAGSELDISDLDTVAGGKKGVTGRSIQDEATCAAEMGLSLAVIVSVCGAAVSIVACPGDACGAAACPVDAACGAKACGSKACAAEAVCGGKACGGEACGAEAICGGKACGGQACGGATGCAAEACGADVCGAHGGCAAKACGAEGCGGHAGCMNQACGGAACGGEAGCAGQACGGAACGGNVGCAAKGCGGDACGAHLGCAAEGCAAEVCGAHSHHHEDAEHQGVGVIDIFADPAIDEASDIFGEFHGNDSGATGGGDW